MCARMCVSVCVCGCVRRIVFRPPISLFLSLSSLFLSLLRYHVLAPSASVCECTTRYVCGGGVCEIERIEKMHTRYVCGGGVCEIERIEEMHTRYVCGGGVCEIERIEEIHHTGRARAYALRVAGPVLAVCVT